MMARFEAEVAFAEGYEVEEVVVHVCNFNMHLQTSCERLCDPFTLTAPLWSAIM